MKLDQKWVRWGKGMGESFESVLVGLGFGRNQDDKEKVDQSGWRYIWIS